MWTGILTNNLYQNNSNCLRNTLFLIFSFWAVRHLICLYSLYFYHIFVEYCIRVFLLYLLSRHRWQSLFYCMKARHSELQKKTRNLFYAVFEWIINIWRSKFIYATFENRQIICKVYFFMRLCFLHFKIYHLIILSFNLIILSLIIEQTLYLECLF